MSKKNVIKVGIVIAAVILIAVMLHLVGSNIMVMVKHHLGL